MLNVVRFPAVDRAQCTEMQSAAHRGRTSERRLRSRAGSAKRCQQQPQHRVSLRGAAWLHGCMLPQARPTRSFPSC